MSAPYHSAETTEDLNKMDFKDSCLKKWLDDNLTESFGTFLKGRFTLTYSNLLAKMNFGLDIYFC